MILLVEDNPELRRAYEIILRTNGYQTTSVGDGAGALACLAGEETPALVLLDISLPDIDGLALLTHIRQTPALESIPVIMYSAHAEKKNQAAALGANAFITKGAEDVEQLLATVGNLIGTR
jgi:CheY-like chemotaxis protein